MTLLELTDGRYKIVFEESWYQERTEVREPDRRWYECIPCKGGAFINIYCEPEPNWNPLSRRTTELSFDWAACRE